MLFLFAFALFGFGKTFTTGNAITKFQRQIFRSPPIITECTDKLDNDLDNTIDYKGHSKYLSDKDCSSEQDNTECLVACSTASDCGLGNYWTPPYCFNNDKYENYITYNCLYPGTCNSSCLKNELPRKIEDCQAADSSGYCQNNVCTTPTGIKNSCTDSDNGLNPRVQGIAMGTYNGFSYSNIDYCISSQLLMESYCVGLQSSNTPLNCITNTTTRCLSGVCI